MPLPAPLVEIIAAASATAKWVRKEGSITMQIAHYASNVILPMTDVQIDLHSGSKTLEYIPTIIMNYTTDRKREKRTREAVAAFGMPIGLYDIKNDHGGLFEMECEERGILSINAELEIGRAHV